MAVRYVRVDAKVDTFTPVIRATGNVAIIGKATAGAEGVPVPVFGSADAAAKFGPAVDADGNPNSALTKALLAAFRQTPGPAQVWGVRADADPAAALTAVENLDAQFVVIAGVPLDATSGADSGAIGKLSSHVTEVSNRGGEGKERMGVAMLARDSTDRSVLTGTLASDRMVYIAHRSDDDAAAAVAGTIAGYPPHVSMLLKQVMITSDQFSYSDIEGLNGQEDYGTVPAGNGINWLTSPSLLGGAGVYLGEGYTGNSKGKRFIDTVRTVDDVSFKLKARLIRAIGDLRIGRSGLRALSVQMESVLVPLQTDGVIEGFSITIPVLDLLDADPDALTPAQLKNIQDIQDSRKVQTIVTIDYAGAIHRIDIALKFT